MIERIIKAGVDLLVKRQVASETQEQREIYHYGLELLVYYIINVAVLLAIGWIYHRAWEVALLLFLFALIQTNGGGYHADTHGKCLLTMIVGVLAFIAVIPLYNENMILQGASVGIGLFMVYRFAPVPHRNHPLSAARMRQLGIRAKVIAAGLAAIWVAAISMAFREIASVLSINFLMIGLSLFMAFLKQKDLKDDVQQW